MGRKTKLHLFSGKNYEVMEEISEAINAIYYNDRLGNFHLLAPEG